MEVSLARKTILKSRGSYNFHKRGLVHDAILCLLFVFVAVQESSSTDNYCDQKWIVQSTSLMSSQSPDTVFARINEFDWSYDKVVLAANDSLGIRVFKNRMFDDSLEREGFLELAKRMESQRIADDIEDERWRFYQCLKIAKRVGESPLKCRLCYMYDGFHGITCFEVKSKLIGDQEFEYVKAMLDKRSAVYNKDVRAMFLPYMKFDAMIVHMYSSMSSGNHYGVFGEIYDEKSADELIRCIIEK